MGIDAYKRELAAWGQPTEREKELARKQDVERRNAEAEMAYQFANRQMPEDIRSRARAWGMEAWAEVLWNNAFQAGYREAIRARGETKKPPGD